MRILIFEPDHSGHRLHHVRLLVDALKDFSTPPVVTLSDPALRSAEYAAQLGSVVGAFQLDICREYRRGGPLRSVLGKVFALRDAVHRVRPDHVIIPYADGVAQVIGAASFLRIPLLPEGIEFEGLLMRGGFAYPRRRLRQRLAAKVGLSALSGCRFVRLHHLDPLSFEYICRRGGGLAERSRLMPDPVEPTEPLPRELARRRLGIPQVGRYIGIAGVLDARKGVDRLIRAYADAALGAQDRLLLVGRLHPAIRVLLETTYAELVRIGRIVLVDRYVSNEDFVTAFSAMDVVCTPYPEHIGSASIVIRAAAAGRPVLASDYGWLGWAVPRFGLGMTCTVKDLRAFGAALSVALDRAREFQIGPEGCKFVAFHSPKTFAGAWTRRLRERLGQDHGTDACDCRSFLSSSWSRVGSTPLDEV